MIPDKQRVIRQVSMFGYIEGAIQACIEGTNTLPASTRFAHWQAIAMKVKEEINKADAEIRAKQTSTPNEENDVRTD